jgi:hypothetical protein
MKKLSIAFLAIALVVLSSCEKERIWGEGPLVTETRALNNFTGVSSAVSGRVNYKIDPAYKVEIIAQRNILDAIETFADNGVLRIRFRNNVSVGSHEDITVNLSSPSIYHLGLSGTGDIEVDGNVTTSHLDMDVSGAGNINVDNAVVSGEIDARISGSGNINIWSGSAINEDLRISGSGSMNMADVAAERAEINISGSGDMKVNLSQSINARISGSGSVLYRGNPAITMQVSGSGTVRPL